MSLEKRAFAGAVAGAINVSLTLGQAVLLVPIFLKSWGQEEYGVWLSVFAAYGILTAFDSGHQNYLGNEFNRLHEVDLDASRRALDNALLIGLLLGGFELLLAVVLVGSDGAEKVLGLDSGPWISEARVALLLLMVAWVISGSIGGILVRLYSPKGLYARAQWLGIAGRLLQLLVTVLVVVAGGGIVAVGAGVAAVALVFSLVVFYDVYRAAPEYWPWLRRPSLRQGAALFGKSTILVCTSVLQQFSVNGLTVIVSSVLTAAALPGFVTSRTIANMLMQVSSVVVQPLYPDLVRWRVKGEPGRFQAMLLGIWFVTGFLVNLLIVASFPFLRPLYLWWTGHLLTFDNTLVICLLIAAALKCYGLPFFSCLAALNNLRGQVISAAVQVGITLGLAKVLLAGMGNFGLGLAIIAGELAGGILLPVWFARLELDRAGGQIALRDFAWHALFTGLTIGAILAMHFLPQYGWFVFGLSLATLLVLAYRRVESLPGEVRSRLERYMAISKWRTLAA